MALAVVLSLIPAAAVAHDHRPPKTALRSPGDRQVGRPYSYTWESMDGEFCQSEAAFGTPDYQRKPLVWRPHRKIHLRLFKRHKPTGLVIRMFRRLENGHLAGKARLATYQLQRARRDGRRFWIAGFFGRRKARHLYLAVHVEYEDVDGCGGTQAMELAFHLLRRTKT